jgi:serine/threonine-protein kinase
MPDRLDLLRAALAERYRIDRELGSGGMAVVYLAEDLRHQRQVAVKVLRPELAAMIGAERFLNEIRVTANLQHSHILPLFDSGDAGGFLYYVMPYVEGETLAARLQRETQLPIPDALRITREVAGALDYAHRHQVIHRDIKPGNIMLHDGQAMVADFGIALAVSAAGGDRMTETGFSLGTPEYMSPEQAAGDRTLDARSDVYSLGAVLYEMLTGAPPHTGPTVQAIIAKVVTEHPRPVREVRDTVPPSVEAALAQALARLPADRFASGADFVAALENPHTTPLQAAGSVRRPFPWRAVAAGAGLWAAVATGAALLSFNGASDDTATSRWAMRLPAEHELGSTYSGVPLAITPAGDRMAFVGQRGGDVTLFVKTADESAPRAVPNTDDARNPFFSPDGQWLAFLAGGKLYKVSVAGGAPLPLADVPLISTGATWGVNDTIVFTTYDARLWHVPAAGGVPQAWEPIEGATGYFMPQRAGTAGAFTVVVTTSMGLRIAVVPGIDQPGRILESVGEAAGAAYGHTGHLVYAQAGVLRAVPFDLSALEVTGPSFALRDSVPTAPVGGAAHFAIAENGTMVHAPAGMTQTLVWVERDGTATPVDIEPANYNRPRISPDGRKIVFTIAEPGQLRLWLYDVETRTRTPLTTGQSTDPVWTPDGERIVFSHQLQPGRWDLVRMPVDGSGELEPLLEGEGVSQAAHSWSPDGTLAYYLIGQAAHRDIYVLPPDGEPVPVLATPANERSPMFSPDGRWLAYVSDESGRDEIYVMGYPDRDRRQRISRGGGTAPVWSRDGTEIFFRRGDQMFVVRISGGTGEFTFGAPELLFRGQYDLEPGPSGSLGYHVTPDGQRFLMLRSEPPQQLNVVLNWFAEVTAAAAR